MPPLPLLISYLSSFAWFCFWPALPFVIPKIASSVACFNLFSWIHLSRAHTSVSMPSHGIGSGERCVRGMQNWKKDLELCDVSSPGYLVEPSCLWNTDLANEGNLQEMRWIQRENWKMGEAVGTQPSSAITSHCWRLSSEGSDWLSIPFTLFNCFVDLL